MSQPQLPNPAVDGNVGRRNNGGGGANAGGYFNGRKRGAGGDQEPSELDHADNQYDFTSQSDAVVKEEKSTSKVSGGSQKGAGQKPYNNAASATQYHYGGIA